MKREYLTLKGQAMHRHRLDSLLRSGLEYELCTVVAGPGYGKTTALVHFFRHYIGALAWLDLTPADNDPGHFQASLVRALGHEAPQLARTVAGLEPPREGENIDTFLQSLSELPWPPLLLVLDCLENLEAPHTQALVRGLVESGPRALRALLCGNDRDRVMAVAGDRPYYLIGPDALAFTQDEIVALFDSYGRQLSAAEAERLRLESDGWPIAVQLMATEPEDEAYRAAATSHTQVLSELFQHNYFTGFDPQTRQLLVRLSYFDQIPLGLIQAAGLADMRLAGRVMTGNIFISQDYDGQFFYLQKPYRDFLALKQGALDPAETERMLIAAGEFFSGHEHSDQALACFWQVRDYDRYMQALLSLPRRNRQLGETERILTQLEGIPRAYREANPAVDFCRGFMHLNGARFRTAKGVFIQVAALLEALPPDRRDSRLLGETYTALADVSLALASTRAVDYARQALALLPGGTQVRARQMTIVGNREVFFLPDGRPGRLAEMAEFPARLARYAAPLFGESGRGYPPLFSAEAAYYAGRFDDVLEHSLRAVHDARSAQQHDIVINALYLQLRMALFLGQGDRASAALSEMEAYIAESGADLTALIDCARATHAVVLGDPGSIPARFSVRERLAADAPLESGRDRLILALTRYVGGDYESAYSALLELQAILEQRCLWGVRLSACVLEAECLRLLGQPKKAVSALWEAAEMAWRNGIITPFAEFGDTMTGLLELAGQQRTFAFDLDWTIAVAKASLARAKRRQTLRKVGGSPSGRRARGVALTDREKQVLGYLSQGLNREEIAGLMGISVHGVKKHISNIYTKLGAVNRAEAIHIALVNGVISSELSS